MLISYQKLLKNKPAIYLIIYPETFDHWRHYQFSKPWLRTTFWIKHYQEILKIKFMLKNYILMR